MSYFIKIAVLSPILSTKRLSTTALATVQQKKIIYMYAPSNFNMQDFFKGGTLQFVPAPGCDPVKLRQPSESRGGGGGGG